MVHHSPQWYLLQHQYQHHQHPQQRRRRHHDAVIHAPAATLRHAFIIAAAMIMMIMVAMLPVVVTSQQCYKLRYDYGRRSMPIIPIEHEMTYPNSSNAGGAQGRSFPLASNQPWPYGSSPNAWWYGNAAFASDMYLGTNTGFERVDTVALVITRNTSGADVLHLLHDAPVPTIAPNQPAASSYFCPGVTRHGHALGPADGCTTPRDSDAVYVAYDMRAKKGTCDWTKMACTGNLPTRLWQAGSVAAELPEAVAWDSVNPCLELDGDHRPPTDPQSKFGWGNNINKGLFHGSRKAVDSWKLEATMLANNPSTYMTLDNNGDWCLDIEYRRLSSWNSVENQIGSAMGIRDFAFWSQHTNGSLNKWAEPTIVSRQVAGTRLTLCALPCTNMCDEYLTKSACFSAADDSGTQDSATCQWCTSTGTCQLKGSTCAIGAVPDASVGYTVAFQYEMDAQMCQLQGSQYCQSCSNSGCGWCVDDTGHATCLPRGALHTTGPWLYNQSAANTTSTFGHCTNGFYYEGSTWANCSAVQTVNWYAMMDDETLGMDSIDEDSWCVSGDGPTKNPLPPVNPFSVPSSPSSSSPFSLADVVVIDTGETIELDTVCDNGPWQPKVLSVTQQDPDTGYWSGKTGTGFWSINSETIERFWQSEESGGNGHDTTTQGLSWMMSTDVLFITNDDTPTPAHIAADRMFGMFIGGVDYTEFPSIDQLRSEFQWQRADHLLCDTAPRRSFQFLRGVNNPIYQNNQVAWPKLPNQQNITVTFAVVQRREFGVNAGLQLSLYLGRRLMFTAVDLSVNSYAINGVYSKQIWGGILSGDKNIYLANLKQRTILPELTWGRGQDYQSGVSTLQANAICNRPYVLPSSTSSFRVRVTQNQTAWTYGFAVFYLSFTYDTVPTNCAWSPGANPYRSTRPTGWTNMDFSIAPTANDGRIKQYQIVNYWQPLAALAISTGRFGYVPFVYIRHLTAVETPVHIYPVFKDQLQVPFASNFQRDIVVQLDGTGAFYACTWFGPLNVWSDMIISATVVDARWSSLLPGDVTLKLFASRTPTQAPPLYNDMGETTITHPQTTAYLAGDGGYTNPYCVWGFYVAAANHSYHPIYNNMDFTIRVTLGPMEISQFLISVVSLPTVGVTGASGISISGKGFGNNGGAAFFNGVPLTLVSGTDLGRVYTDWPPGTGVGNLTIRTGDPTGLSPYYRDTVYPFSYTRPTFTSLSPSDTSTQGGVVLILQGANFGMWPSRVSVTIGGRACTILNITATMDTLYCLSPPGYGASNVIGLTVDGLPATSTGVYKYEDPHIDSFSPMNGPVVGSIITIYGRGFYNGTNSFDGTGVIFIKMGSQFCLPPSSPSMSMYGRVNHTVAYCIVPPSIGAVIVSLQVGIVNINAAYSFVYDLPVINQVAPAHGPTDGGYPVSIVGYNFGPPGIQYQLKVNGDVLSGYSLNINDTCLMITTWPAGSGAVATIYIRQNGQLHYQGPLLFSYDAPVINSISPATAPTTTGVYITLYGDNFGVWSSPQINAYGSQLYSAASTIVNHHQAVFNLPVSYGLGQYGTGLVQLRITQFGVIEGTDQTSAPVSLFYWAAPQVTSASTLDLSTSVSGAGSRLLTINGANFGSSDALIVVGMGGNHGNPSYTCILTNVASTRLICDFSAITLAGGTDMMLNVTVNGRTAPDTAHIRFSFPPPIINNVIALSGSMAGGYMITLVGENFSGAQAYMGSTSMTTTVNCALASAPHCELRATVPAGEAASVTISVRTPDGQQATYPFAYDAPRILKVTPTNGPAAGGTLVTITGTSLGAPFVTSTYQLWVESAGCYASICGADPLVPQALSNLNNNFIVYNSTTLIFAMPGGTGIATFRYRVNDRVNDDIVTSVQVKGERFSYDAMVVTSLTGCPQNGYQLNPSGNGGASTTRQCPLVGGTIITVRGYNFGPYNGANQYSSPSLIIMANMYIAPDEQQMYVNRVNDTFATFSLPASPTGGFNYLISFILGDIQVDTELLSYYGPILAALPFDPTCTSNYVSSYTLPSVNGGQYICISGTDFGTTISLARVELSVIKPVIFPPDPPQVTGVFTCDVTELSTTRIKCRLNTGAGMGVTFRVIYDGVYSDVSSAVIHYPAPVVMPLTLRARVTTPLDDLDGILSSSAAPGQGSSVVFNVKHVPSNYQWLYLIRVGLARTAETIVACDNIKIWSPQGSGDAANRTYVAPDGSLDIKAVQCTTPIGYALPDEYHFSISVMGQIATGTDTYNYPRGGPTVDGVFSYTCQSVSNVSLINCDTKGGAVLTITGTNFCDPDLDSCVMQIKIGSVDCGLPYTYFSDTTISCILPSSTGISLPVTLQIGGSPSSSVNTVTVTYSPAYITAVSGCTATITGLATIDCDNTLSSSFSTSSYSSSDSSYSLSMFNNDNNNGNNNGQMVLSSVTSMPMLTIRGYNFGPSSAIILVAGQICSNVTHDSLSPHNIITCVLPPGRLTQQSISIIPSGGLMSTSDASSVYVSYRQCGLGTWRSLSSNTSYTCNDCAIGTYSNKRGSEACTSCPMGRTANITGSTACVTCTAGRYANGNVTCRRCDLGTYSTSNGKMGCSLCPAGTIADARGATACVACAIGSYQISIGASSCISCGQSEYQPSKGSLSCIACPYGKTNASISAASCVDCPAGRARGMNDGASCVACPLGTYSLAGSQSCIQCGSGTYADTIESPSCKPCAAGNYSVGNPDSGPRICTPCAAGTYTATTGQKQCLRCPQGTYNPLTGASSCLPCDAGTVGNGDQAISCSSPPYGTFVSSSGSVISDACLPGTYSIGDTSGTIACTECPAGRSQKNSGQSYCEDCTPGRATALTGQRECPACSSGRYTSLSGQETCDDCELGEYASPGQPCSLASAGRYALLQQSQPYDCPAGRWTDQQGTYQNDSLPCYACPPGYKSRDQLPLLRDGCDQCPIGRYAKDEGSAVCLSCPPGFICPTIQMTSPVACQPGTYNPASGAITCLACGAGMGNPLEGQSSCTPCSAGSFANTTTGLCDSCIAGRYTPSANSSVCLLCPSGKSTDTAGQTSCLSCDSGRYNQLTGQTSCAPCQAGKYGNGSIALCGLCNVGSYSSVEGQGTCLQCPLGRYGNGTGLTDCLPCSLGAYSSASGKSACDLCQVGSYSPITSAISCTLCPAGQYQPANGSFICIPCPIGTYNGQVGASSCAICTPGTYNPSTGQAKCLLCGQGTYNTVYNATSCDSCQAGTIQSIEGSTTCVDCQPGFAAFGIKNAQCSTCLAGTYSDATAAEECTSCKAGTFQNNTQTSFCFSCEPGQYQSVSGATVCEYCSDISGSANGFFNPYYGRASCEECPGLMTATVGGLSCDCGKGSFSYAPAQNESDCYVCPSGASCTRVGLLITQMDAISGWWRPSNMSTAFYECLLPTHCLGGSGTSSCASLRSGPLCAMCVADAIPSSGGGCSACKSRGLNWFQTIIIIIFIIIIMIAMYYAVLAADRRLLAAAAAEENARIKRLRAGISAADLPSPADKRRHEALLASGQHTPGTNGHGSSSSSPAVFTRDLPTPTTSSSEYSKKSILDRDDHDQITTNQILAGGHKPNFTYKLKILLGYFQIGTSLVTLLDVQWPTGFKSFFIVFNVFNLDFLQWTSIACVASINYYTKFVFAAIIPPMVLALIFLFYVLPFYIYHWRRRTVDHTLLARRVRESWKLLLFTLFIIYPKVSSTIMNMYACRTVEGYSYIITDFSSRCDDDKWHRYLPANIITILLYPIGIPVFFFILLVRARHDFDSPGVRLQLGFLYDGYRRGTWYFELIDMTHKFILTALLQFLPTFVQIRFGMAIVVAYLMVILVQQPYYRKGDDRFHLFAQIQILLILIAAGLFHDGTPDDVSNAAMSVFLIMLCIAFLLFFIGQSANIIRKRFGHLWKEFKYRLRTGKSLAEVNSGGGEIVLSDDGDNDINDALSPSSYHTNGIATDANDTNVMAGPKSTTELISVGTNNTSTNANNTNNGNDDDELPPPPPPVLSSTPPPSPPESPIPPPSLSNVDNDGTAPPPPSVV